MLQTNYRTPHLGMQSESEYSGLIKALSDRNTNSVATGQLAVENNTLTIPLTKKILNSDRLFPRYYNSKSRYEIMWTVL